MAEASPAPVELGIEAIGRKVITTTTIKATKTRKEEKEEEEAKKDKELDNGLNPFYSQVQTRVHDEENHSILNPFHVPCPPRTHPQESVEAALICGVCLREFDSEYRRPILLPHCGHTFCRTCVKGLELRGDQMYCPSCRHEYKDTDVDNFPVNFNIQVLASGGKKTKVLDASDCSDHGVRYAFWCRSCEVPACGECLYEGHPQPSHGVCRIQDVVMEVKSRAEELVKEANEEAKNQLAGCLRRVLQGISDLQEASHILQEASRIARRFPASTTLPAITSVFESAKKMRRRVEEMKCVGDAVGDNGDSGVGGGDLSGVFPGSPSSLSSSYSSSTSSSSSTLSSLRAGMSGRPVVVALSETGGLAQVKVEQMGIHIYSIRPASTAFCVAAKLSVLLSCSNKASPVVFLDIKAGERPLGRVYIKLWGEMRRAEQFFALCLGTFGPSYRDTRFDGVNGRGEPGEYVRGGDYMKKQGLGGEALMDNLEWGGRWTKPMQAGQVCGVGGEDSNKFGALFAICLRDNPSNTFRAPFGMVTSGLEVIEVACRHDPFGVVRVAECGVVIDV